MSLVIVQECEKNKVNEGWLYAGRGQVIDAAVSHHPDHNQQQNKLLIFIMV